MTLKLLGVLKIYTVNDNTNDETEEIKGKITAANTAYSSLHITFRCKQIHRKNKIRLHETLMKPKKGTLTY